MKLNPKKTLKNPKLFYKLLGKKTAIIAGVVLFGLLLPKFVLAQRNWLEYVPNYQLAKAAVGLFKNITEGSIISFGEAVLAKIVEFVFWLFHWLVMAGGAVFNAMLNMGFTSHIDIVRAGWEVTRNIANMFFILFLVIIAFATILRIERYGIKQLLPKVIIIALLINFSLVICSVIIDFTNITAKFFAQEIIENSEEGGASGGASGRFIDSLNVMKLHKPIACEELPDEPGVGLPSLRQQCLQAQNNTAGQAAESFTTFLVSLTVGSIVLLVAAFVLFAGAFMLLIRIVIIWFLLIFVPLVFLCYIMPGLRSMWQKWWSTFLRWCFFAPAYAFFVWLAMKVSMEASLGQVVNQSAPYFANMGPVGNIFTSTPGAALLHYCFIIALLLGGLIAASKFGIYGSSAAMNIVQKSYRGAKSWATRTSMRPVKTTATAAGVGALKFGSKVFGVFGGEETKLGRRMGAKAKQLRRAPETRPEHEAYRKLTDSLDDKGLLKEVETAKGIRKFIATQKAAQRGLLREASSDQVNEAMTAMRAYGASDQARTLEELRPEAIANEGQRNEAIERAIANGTHRKWSKKTFEDEKGKEVIGELTKQLTPGEFADVFKTWAADIKTAAQDALIQNFSGDFKVDTKTGKPKKDSKDEKNINVRKAYAKATGDVDTAFYADSGGKPQDAYKTRPDINNQAEAHIKSLDADGFGKLKGDESKKLAARYMAANQVETAGIKFSGSDKELIKSTLEQLVAKEAKTEEEKTTQRERQKVLDQIEISVSWGGKPQVAPQNTVDLSGKKETPKTPKEEKEPPFSTV